MRRLASAAAAASIAAVVVPATASADLVVEGAANRAADWTTTAPVSLALEQAKLTTSGAIAGLAVEDLDAGQVRSITFDGADLKVRLAGAVPGTFEGPESPAISAPEVLTLQPGRYRLRLFGDGDVTAVVPGVNARFDATLPSAASVSRRDLRAGGVATEVLRATSEFDFAEGGGAFYGYHESTQVTSVDAHLMCVRPAGTDNCVGQANAGAGVGVHPSAGTGWQRGWYHLGVDTAPDYAPGRYVGELTYATAGLSKRFDELVVVVPPSQKVAPVTPAPPATPAPDVTSETTTPSGETQTESGDTSSTTEQTGTAAAPAVSTGAITKAEPAAAAVVRSRAATRRAAAAKTAKAKRSACARAKTRKAKRRCATAKRRAAARTTRRR